MLKVHLMGYNSVADITGLSSVVASQNREIMQNSDKIWPYSNSRSCKAIDIGVNRKLTCDFLLIINSNFGNLLPFSRYWRLGLMWLIFSILPLFDAPVGGH